MLWSLRLVAECVAVEDGHPAAVAPTLAALEAWPGGGAPLAGDVPVAARPLGAQVTRSNNNMIVRETVARVKDQDDNVSSVTP